MKIKAVKLKDINEKDMYYITFENTKGNRENINVGEKTFNKIQNLINGELDTTTDNKTETDILKDGNDLDKPKPKR